MFHLPGIRKGLVLIKRIISSLYIVAGFISLGLGIIGIVLPVVPTTPLLLLASFFFVKGSKKFEVWFQGTSIYKKHLEGFIKERSMTLKQKVTILLFADFTIAFPFFILDSIPIKIMFIVIVIYKYYYFIFKIKTVKPNSELSKV
ncbi:YbaN family protein [Bacillus tianshenii]|uniref:YbaN family protein n=1 Tax=Sutcliffiella tianshenii TaxID=1463404 RepID=UPI001CD37164|nr:YbaN family protein [Bacillus tianshenii]MCA1322224.1 YbaN family protein [Bacillus tianshenii]